jgi:subtilisin family serine protease
MLDSRLKFLVEQAETKKELDALESTGRFALMRAKAKEPEVTVLVQLNEDVSEKQLEKVGFKERARAGDVRTGTIALSSVAKLDALPETVLVESSRPMVSELDVSVDEIRADLVHTGPPGYRGSGVIIGIIDTGIDWRHQSFRDGAGNSRVLRIWDQNLVPQGTEASPAPFGYGVEYDKPAIDTALASADPLAAVRHMDDAQGHGTHVAGIAAGDGSAAGNGQPAFTFGGVAPEADIVVVANQVTTLAMGDSASTLDAVQYIFDLAQTLGRPAVINQSQGDNLGPHDGTSLLERGIDNLLGAGGRCYVKSAGNAAGGGVHASGTVTAGGTSAPQIVVPANDTSPDTIDIWYAAADRIDFRITPPGGVASATVSAGSSTTITLPNGNQVFVDSVLAHPNNGDNRIYVQLVRGSQAAVEAGTWTLTLTGATVAAGGGWHAWIERGTTVPQFVAPFRNDDVTISVPGTSTEVITAGSYITKGAGVGGLSTFSSRGPTRDGRAAPTLSAPGQSIMSAKSLATGTDQYQGMSGTSMSAPHVAGVVALMLQAKGTMTQTEIADCLRNTARSDAFATGVPNNDWGAGKIDAKAALDCAVPPPKLKITDDPVTQKFVDDKPTIKTIDDPATLKFRDERPTLKLADERPTLKTIDEPATLKFRDERPTIKTVDEGPTAKFADERPPSAKFAEDPKTKFTDDPKLPEFDEPLKHVADRFGFPRGAASNPAASGAVRGGVEGSGRTGPFVLATPHHSMAWAQEHPEAAAAAVEEMQQLLESYQGLLQQYDEAYTSGQLTEEDLQQANALWQEYVALATELGEMNQGQ